MRPLALSLVLSAPLLCGACRDAPRGAPVDPELAGLIRRAPARPPLDKLTPELRRKIEGKRADAGNRRLRLLVDLTTEVDFSALARHVAGQRLTRSERRRAAITAMHRVAAESQRELAPVLERLEQRGDIETYRGFTVINRVLVVGSHAAVRALAERPEVASIVAETEEVALTSLTGVGQDAPRSRSWAIASMGADRAWAEGVDGRGVTVGIIDAGASAAHEQLQENFRGGDSGWYDPTGESVAPQDVLPGHGTTVLSGAVGRNVGGRVVGVAPRARWAACVGLPKGRYNNVRFTECADFMLTVAQPDVLINAWLLHGAGCDTSLRPIVDAWRAAEILPVFAAGNEGPAASTGGSPANYVGLYPGERTAFSVGALAAKKGEPFPRSSRGPNACDGSVYPTVVAPGEDVLAAFPLTPSTYVSSRGTSVAAGLAAGAAALLLQRFPEASVAELEDALRAGARDVGAPGPDNVFGYGRLYVPSAFEVLARRAASSARPTKTSVAAIQR